MIKFKKILAAVCAVFAIGFVAGCDSNSTPSSTKKPVESVQFVDYVEKTKLDQTVTSSSNFFKTDGVAFAKLSRCVDGDTALFEVNGEIMTARFLGVDTPESTGQIEKWGKTASYFTQDKLTTAESIVVQTNGGDAEKDTSGDRWLTYIWYRTTANDDYRLLNLELVQEGLSYGKSSTATKYASQLIEAQAQAMRMKLRLFGKSKDPNFFDGDAIETTIKYIVENQATLVEQTARVKFDCTVVRNDGYYVYAQDIDPETLQVYSILLYKGYNLSTKKLENGNRVSVCGNVTVYDNQIQITSMQDIPLSTSLDNIQLISTGNSIDCKTINPSDLNISDTVILRRFVKLENIEVTSLWTTQTGDSKGAVTITGKCNGQTVTVRTSVLYKENYELITQDVYKDKTITVSGIVELYDNAYQVRVVSFDDITFLN